MLAACGRVGFEPTGGVGANDATTDGTSDGVGSDGESPPSDLLLWLSFDEDTASGILNRGSLSTTIACELSCPTLVPGIDDNAFDFDGTNDALRVTDQTALHLDAGTFAAWIRPDVLPNIDDYSVFISRAFGGADSDTWEMFLLGTASGTTNISFGGDASGGYYTSDQWSRGTGVWTHVAATWDGTTMRLYVGGMLRSMAAQFIASFDVHDHFIGADEASPNTLGWFFGGRIDELRVYNRVLSSTEIMSLATP